MLHFDVAIVGGGPGGSTVGALIRKYMPALSVAIIEREAFPREHVGESQLPPVGRVLHDMGAWDKVEAANFIVKLGANYTWGKQTEPWLFGFVSNDQIRDEPRPARYEGWRQKVAFQVDRASYDDILLRHSAELGCQVLQPVGVREVVHADDEIRELRLDDGRVVTAKHYVDASGDAAVIRRALGVKVDVPTALQNVAFWEYWQKPGLNSSLLETRTIRILIRSLPYGWLWYIALDENRSSVGLVTPAEYFQKSGKSPEALYHESVKLEQSVNRLLAEAAPDGKVRARKDWSFVSERGHGRNWFLVGEALGFADPILSAGMALTHTCAQHCAYLIMELERGEHERDWLLKHYDTIQLKRIRQHIKFADYWYSGNGFFSAIEENCARIAAEAGLKMTPEAAFRWLSNGGIDDDLGAGSTGGVNVSGLRALQWRMGHESEGPVTYNIDGKTHFKLRMEGAELTHLPLPLEGRIHKVPAWQREQQVLPMIGGYKLVFDALQTSPLAADFMNALQRAISGNPAAKALHQAALECLEWMVVNGWVKTSQQRGKPALRMQTPKEGQILRSAE
ncbi:MAG: tryptophan 7-halogenase [Planctomycetes bacterium]|nr:tryptophan 7-halogenase [Planctomycetota bacterium]